jgi:hypothetical protein
MEYAATPPRASLRGYDHVVSIGNNCDATITLRALGIYGPAFPFDYIPTTPDLVLKYIIDPAGFLPERGSVYNADGVWFGHFDVDERHAETAAKFKRRFERLYCALRGTGRVLFLYTAAGDVFNQMGNRHRDNHADLQRLMEYVRATFQAECKLVCVHTNRSFEDTDDCAHGTVHVPDEFLSDDMSTHTHEVVSAYRAALKRILGAIA